MFKLETSDEILDKADKSLVYYSPITFSSQIMSMYKRNHHANRRGEANQIDDFISLVSELQMTSSVDATNTTYDNFISAGCYYIQRLH